MTHNTTNQQVPPDISAEVARKQKIDAIIADINKLREVQQEQIAQLFAASPLGAADAVGDRYRRRRSIRQVAERLRISVAAARRLFATGALHRVRFGSSRKLYVDEAELESFRTHGIAACPRPSCGVETDAACTPGQAPTTGTGVEILDPQPIDWAAKELNSSRGQVLAHIRAGRLRAIRYSPRHVLVDENEVRALRLTENRGGLRESAHGEPVAGPDSLAERGS